MFRRILLAAAVSFGLFAPAPLFAQRRDRERTSSEDLPRTSPKVMSAFGEVVANPSKATVRILCDGKEVALGAVVGADGWIITKATELKEKPAVKFKDGRTLDARVVGIHDPYDLALLKVDAKNLPTISWGDTKNAVPGNFVAAPGPSDMPVAIGVVSVAARKVRAIDMPPVNSNSGFLGVQMESVDNGVKIVLVVPKSPAEKAGIKVNDVIFKVDDKLIPDMETMQDTIMRYKAGDEPTIMIRRDSKEIEVKAKLDKRQGDARADFQNRLGGSLSDRRGGFPMILQHDTVLKPNECGGPLVDLDGKTIGINVARAGRVETYAAPAEAIVALLPDMKAGKYAPKEIAIKTESDEVRKARETLKKAEAELAEAQKKADELKKKVDDAKKALEKAEGEPKKSDK
jgi:serine protease Do